MKNGKIIRWVDQNGKQQIVANGEYAPEHEELFKARYAKVAYDNQLVLQNNPHNKEVEQIDLIVSQIDSDIKEGKYKKGDVYESYEGEGGEKREEYVDNKGRLIYKYEYSGGEYSSESTTEYHKNGALIYSLEHQQSSNFYNAGFMGTDLTDSNRKIYHFKDGKRRIYYTESFSAGNIIEIWEGN